MSDTNDSGPGVGLESGSLDRHASWLELFFDLVFVASISAFGSHLADQSSLLAIAAYLPLFVPLWWAWVGHTVYSNRFGREDALHRTLTFVIMLAAAAMMLQLDRLVATGGLIFASGYLVARIALLALYARARKHEPGRTVSDIYLRGFGLGASVWLLSLFVPPPTRYVMWGVGMLVDMATPWLGRPQLQRAPLQVTHLPERMGLFTIILLGECIVAQMVTLSQEALVVPRIGVALLSFAIAVAIWRAYFSFVESARYECRLGSGQPYIYSHLPIALGLMSLAAGIKRAIHEAADPVFSQETLFLLGLGAVVWLIAFLGIQLVSYVAPPKRQTWTLSTVSAGILMLVLAGSTLAPWVSLSAMATLFALVAWLQPSRS